MKTYLNTKTGKRYPEHGWDSWVRMDKGDIFLRGSGWKKVPKKEKQFWIEEIIPDLEIEKVHPSELSFEDRQKFKEYTEKYGQSVSQEFMWTCDVMKSTEAGIILKQNAEKEDEEWFEKIFGQSIYKFRDAFCCVLGFTVLDTIKFNVFLENDFEKPEDCSMKDFLDNKFGNGTTERIMKLGGLLKE